MTTPGDIRNLSSKVSANQGTLRQKNNAVTSNANKVNASWKGEISDAYKDAQKNTQAKMSKLISDLGNLKARLDTLANAINMAAIEEAAQKVVK